MRLVCSPDGKVEIDESKKKPGRGAYLCPERTCWENGLKNKKLEHNLKTSIDTENKDKLMRYGENFS